MTDQRSNSQEMRQRNGGAQKLRVLDLFSGIGGFHLGLERAGGFETVAFCERNTWSAKSLPKGIPVHADVTCLNASDVGPVDVICGGFPCQDASIANVEGAGTDGERTGLFRHIIRLARDLQPELIILENVPELLNRGFGDVLGALAEIGYDAQWDCVSASSLGLPHKRERLIIVAYPQCSGRSGSLPDRNIFVRAFEAFAKHGDTVADGWAALVRSEPVLRERDGLSLTMERRRLFQCGNAVVPHKIEAIGRAILEARAAA